ncbi:CPBP family intramembrane metalloprotease [Sulfitobacter sp. KE34]|uniref:CPBP family intramembrane metalloprotease n=2 Tax=Sulfitobacter TaxID=60136 RepID=A0AAX3LN79_9RHOB|nr:MULTISPECIES: CPBP family intramembrane glutamic endopeptidase [Sulfitobacter]MDF3349698.1 CPBP family intramembrane metalloprotease [Sulfitobacter sp. KE12]MDF3353370.1 CPBP family intramembrane metalloprotease [Sulfitobacter sp. KE27]MDF3357017.1 CPBP family intramembrane metalloprotease [Sulfitobacter sp. KE33]MDF3362074.1 CPBP family intramembrane metalloprotease [Sulfitobacter sp. Ks41]MDF3364441.1 CPBP family intramembrane metalloprotease [Sulfitobacter sp. Ks34]
MNWRPDYSAHAAFVAPARSTSALWRFFLGLFVAVVAYVALNELYFQTVYGLAGSAAPSLHGDLLKGATPQAMYLLLFSFGTMAMAVAVTVRIVHRRSAGSLFGLPGRLWPSFRAVSGAMLLLGVALAVLPPWSMGGELTPNLPLSRWLLLLPLSLLAVLVQVSAEEIVFRGYVQQQLAARFNAPLIWMVLPSALFAAGHYLPAEAGENALMVALWAGFFGILMADLTARSGSLGPAIAVHLWNNVSAILIVSLPDDLSGLALYLTPFSMDDAAALRSWLPVDFALMLVSWLAARLAIRR